jgi:nicotinate-nucleotide adenylyltransferase
VERLKSRLGIFGGTFDPPHVGHQILASESIKILDLDIVLWVLTPDPPHKPLQEMAPLADRLSMVEAIVDDDRNFIFSNIDINRSPPHFADETILLLHQKYPSDTLIYLIGGDSLITLPSWHNSQKLVDACDEIGVMCRPGNEPDLVEIESQLPGIIGKIRFIPTPLLEISSSQIRKRISSERPYRYFLPDKVYKIIQTRNLYK